MGSFCCSHCSRQEQGWFLLNWKHRDTAEWPQTCTDLSKNLHWRYFRCERCCTFSVAFRWLKPIFKKKKKKKSLASFLVSRSGLFYLGKKWLVHLTIISVLCIMRLCPFVTWITFLKWILHYSNAIFKRRYCKYFCSAVPQVAHVRRGIRFFAQTGKLWFDQWHSGERHLYFRASDQIVALLTGL